MVSLFCYFRFFAKNKYPILEASFDGAEGENRELNKIIIK